MKPTRVPRRYGIHSIFGPTIQGEGAMSGVTCIFIRFTGCNMWDGRPETRETSICPFCDTDFLKGTMLTIPQIVATIQDLRSPGTGWIWISGGEPSMQLDKPLVLALKQQGFMIGVETNGTRQFKDGTLSNVDHLVMSPKLPAEQIEQRWCNSLKVLYPHPNPLIQPEHFLDIRCDSRWLQAIEADTKEESIQNMNATINRLYELPRAHKWKLSVQTHKTIGVE